MKILNKKWLGVGLALLCLTANTLSAFCRSNLELAAGWRRDHFQTRLANNNFTDNRLFKGIGLEVWQVGVEGRFIPDFDSCGCDNWFSNFFLRGYAYWGNVGDGKYQNSLYITRRDPLARTNLVGEVHRGHTRDYNIGVGYLFSATDCFKIGPTVGYSYHRLRFQATNVLGVNNFPRANLRPIGAPFFTEGDEFAFFDEGRKIETKWTGPWLGLDASFSLCNVCLSASYEYHWAKSHGSLRSRFDDFTDAVHYSRFFKGSRNGHGHVAVLDVTYPFSDCWSLGFNLKYHTFRGKNRVVPRRGDFVAVGITTADYREFSRPKWSSFWASWTLAYQF